MRSSQLSLFTDANETGLAARRRRKPKRIASDTGAQRIDTSPVSGELSWVCPLRFEEVSRSERGGLWDEMVRAHHYLGYHSLVGTQLKYLIWSRDGRLLAATAWNSAVWKLRARDAAIGWNAAERRRHLHRLANNSRFLIFPWVRVPHLASHLLARQIPILRTDWQSRTGAALALLETFVDPQRFSGASYKAANWIHVGATRGFAKEGRRFRFHGQTKEVFVYPLTSDVHQALGCDKAPLFPLTHRYFLSLTEFHTRREEMQLQHTGWNPKLPPPFDLTDDDLKQLTEEFRRYHALFRDCFGRVEHEPLSRCYVQGLMSPLPRKSMEPIALSLMGTKRVVALQRFINAGAWDVEDLAQRHRQEAAKTVADPLGVFSTDGCDFPKKGKESVGVARQYCGPLGKTDNCQAGVFLAYSSPKGYALLDRRLYLPESWFAEEQKKRWEACRIPESTTFKTKPELALEMIRQAHASGLFPARWVTGDDSFGGIPAFRDGLPQDLHYLLDIPCNTLVWTKRPETHIPHYSGMGQPPKNLRLKKGQPQARQVDAIARDPSIRWQRVTLAEGAKGPIEAEVARLRVMERRNKLPGQELWLFLRRSLADGQIKYAFSNAPADIPFKEMIRVSTLRWPIEQCFQEGKSEIGMDHYEHRSWPAWHRHMTFVFVAQLFLLRMRHTFKKKSRPDVPPGVPHDGGGPADENVQPEIRPRHAPLLSETKPCGLRVPS